MLKIEDNFTIKLGDRIVIGCSTGPDSMALLDMLMKVREKYQLSLIVAHVNHNVRKESQEEEQFLKKFSKLFWQILKKEKFLFVKIILASFIWTILSILMSYYLKV